MILNKIFADCKTFVKKIKSIIFKTSKILTFGRLKKKTTIAGGLQSQKIY